jgi:cell division protein FtsN
MPRLTTRDYKRSSRGPNASKLREFGLGVLVGAVLASAAFLFAGAYARHRASAAAHARPAAGSPHAAPDAPVTDGSASNASDAPATPASASPSSSPSAAAHAATQAPQYDFYRMLPRLNVPVPHDEGHSSHPPPSAASQPVRAAGASGASYVLQVGSYRSSAEAAQVRARLARVGISAQVERIAEGSRTWNRVRIGPLSDAELARVRAELRTANIHALVIRTDR